MWTPTFILAVIAAFVIKSSTGDFIQSLTNRPSPLPKKLPFSLQRPRVPRGIYDPPPYTYEGDVPKTPPTADHPIFRSIGDDVKFNLHTRTGRSLSSPKVYRGSDAHPTKTFKNWVAKGNRRRIARDIRLPGPDFEVPKIPFIPPGGFPWDHEQFDRVPMHRRPIG